MKKEQIAELKEFAYDIIGGVQKAIKELTAENPLILFDKDKIEEDDGLYDYPFGYVVGRHGDYISGQVMKVQGDEFVLFATGDNYGETFDLEISQLPFESLVSILDYLEERSAE
jgi:hypothetical protein